MQTILSQEDRTRVYCCFRACRICGAQRGEYCRDSKGRPWKKGYHWPRGPFSDRIMGGRTESAKKYRARYEKLKAQVLKQRTNCAGCGKPI